MGVQGLTSESALQTFNVIKLWVRGVAVSRLDAPAHRWLTEISLSAANWRSRNCVFKGRTKPCGTFPTRSTTLRTRTTLKRESAPQLTKLHRFALVVARTLKPVSGWNENEIFEGKRKTKTRRCVNLNDCRPPQIPKKKKNICACMCQKYKEKNVNFYIIIVFIKVAFIVYW